jgi:hypothetical protein
MEWDFYKTATAFKDIMTPLGVLGGGLWAYFRFRIQRDKETALAIDLTYTTAEYGSDTWLTLIDIGLNNKGKVQVKARESEPAYDHEYGVEHRHEYGFGLKFRKIPSNLNVNSWVDWFGDVDWEESLPEVNLLKGYVKSAGDKLQTDFWMEPGECYSFAAPYILGAGLYLALVTFVGSSDKVDELWQREFLIQVPCTNTASEITHPLANEITGTAIESRKSTILSRNIPHGR